MVPASVCHIPHLSQFQLYNNPSLTCYPSCLNSATNFYYNNQLKSSLRCPSAQDSGVCGLISATNVGSVHSEWSCDTSGVPSTPPCGLGNGSSWSMLSCVNGEVVGIHDFSGFSGSFPSSLNLLTSLSYLDIHDNDFTPGEICLV